MTHFVEVTSDETSSQMFHEGERWVQWWKFRVCCCRMFYQLQWNLENLVTKCNVFLFRSLQTSTCAAILFNKTV